MMSESGIDVGSGAYVSLFMGMARGGKSWEEISLKITEVKNFLYYFYELKIYFTPKINELGKQLERDSNR